MNANRFAKKSLLASAISQLSGGGTRVSRLTLGVAMSLSVAIITLPATVLAAEEAVLEEILVTGSHIRREDTFNSSSPIATLDSSLIEGVGVVNISELLGQIPSITGDVTGASANVNDPSSSGISTVALRNLGSARTLVLVNGRRYVSGVSASAGYGVDLNAIPATLIERVEVLTGAQSVAYGSDAMAGVINVITKTDFEGLALTGQTGQSLGGSRKKNDINLTLGKNFDGGNVWFSAGYSDDEGLLASDRGRSSISQNLGDTDGDGLADTPVFNGSSFIPGTRLIGGGVNIKGDGSPFNGNTVLGEPTERLNFNAFRSMLIPLERRFAAAGTSFDIGQTKITAEFNYARVESRARFEPIPFSPWADVYRLNRGGESGVDIADDPLWKGSSAGEQFIAAGVDSLDDFGQTFRRTVELGDRGSGNNRSTFRFAAAVDHEFKNGMYLNVYGTYGLTEQVQTDFGDINLERAALALDLEPDGAGGYQCADPVARINGCVPINPYGTIDSLAGQAGITGFSEAGVDYVSAAVGLQGNIEQTVLAAVLAGDFSVGNIEPSFAVGVEYREESGTSTPDGLRQKGISRGYNIQPTSGKFDVFDVFGELSIPFLEQLNLDLAARIGNYSTVGTITTWKVGIDAPINETFRVRAALSTAIRAPNVSDLFAGRFADAVLSFDPCNMVTDTTAGDTATNCRSINAIQDRIDDTTAFTLSQTESQNTLTFNSGNPDVKEETANSFTLGLVITPASVENFGIAIDYYQIKIEDAIINPSGTVVLGRCHDVAPDSFDPTCGGNVFRDPRGGAALDVEARANNEDTITTSGIDLELSYLLPLGPGSLLIGWSLNYLDEYKIRGSGGDVQNLRGEVLFPKIRTSLNLSYDTNAFNIFARFRHRDSTQDRNDNTTLSPERNSISSVTYVDLRGSWKITDKINLYVGSQNLFNESPPQLTGSHKYYQPGTETNGTAFDVTGRQWYAGFQLNL